MNESFSNVNVQKRLSKFKIWLLAVRLKTLPISLPPILVATALAGYDVDHINWIIVLCALLFSLGIHIGTNLINDAYDFKRGADATGRLGPKRMTQEGLLSFQQVLQGSFIAFTFALLCSIPLILAGGWPLTIVVVLSVLSGVCYTAGPCPLSYTALGDFFVLIFFGWVSTCTLYFLLTGFINISCFIAATQVGLLAVAPLAIQNFRDHISDARVNKRTLAVRFGPFFSKCEIIIVSLLPFLLGVFWIEKGFFFMGALPFLSLPLMTFNLKRIWNTTEPSPILNVFFHRSARYGLLFTVLLVLGLLLG